MCGIAGIFLFNAGNKDRLHSIEDMTSVLSHRGPDDNGYFFHDQVALGHRRLSIVDLSSNAKQPMFNEDGSLAMVFNGEIYNFKEQRKSLIAKGHEFKSASDSEVILHLYEEYGVECAKYLEGMFAFAIYDLHRKTLYFARDRVGEKPLYYFKDQFGFYFSSEIKSFFSLDNFDRNLSKAGIYTYFNYIQIPAPQTIFEGVKKLRPAHWLLLKPNGEEISKSYWHVNCTKKVQVSLHEAKDQLKQLMQDSVRKMLVSDVPVGLMLSGGVDSSLILALANEAGSSNLTTFTVGNDSSNIKDEECVRALKFAEKFDVKNYVYDFESPEFSELVDAAKLCDEPVGLLEIFYIFGLVGKIKDKVKVLLAGNGADEIFAGYAGYCKTTCLAKFSDLFKGVIRASNGLLTSSAASFNVLSNWFVLKGLFSEELKQDANSGLPQNLLSDSMSLVSYDNVLDAKLFMDLFVLCNHGVSSIPDISGMSYSVEMRSPFLHYPVIEFAATLPMSFKVNDTKNPLYNKMILKELACDYLSREDVFAPKYGFGYYINAHTLMRTKWRKDIESCIFDPLLHEAGFFKMQYVISIWDRFLTDKLSSREKLIFARFVMFCVWYKYNFSVR